jgi:hypothetical protein
VPSTSQHQAAIDDSEEENDFDATPVFLLPMQRTLLRRALEGKSRFYAHNKSTLSYAALPQLWKQLIRGRGFSRSGLG